MEPLGGIILAAGLSSRMGRYKPLIEVQGRSMIGHVIDRMRGAGASPIVVVTGHQSELLRQSLEGEAVEFVHNPDYAHTQQLESLRLGLCVLKGRCARVLISPADGPPSGRRPSPACSPWRATSSAPSVTARSATPSCSARRSSPI